MTVDMTNYWSNEETAERAQAFINGERNGFSRAASYLLDVPAWARQAISGEAHSASNATGGRYADHVWSLSRPGTWQCYATSPTHVWNRISQTWEVRV